MEFGTLSDMEAATHARPETRPETGTDTDVMRASGAGPRSPVEEAWDLMRDVLSDGEVVDRMGGLSKETGLSPGMMKALQRLRRDRFLSMRDMARGLGCDPSYITGLVDELASRGLVERQSDPDDRRVKTVVLTADGVRTAGRIGAVLGVPPVAFGVLTEPEARNLADLLSKVTGGRGR